MALVPALDLRLAEDDHGSVAQIPHNIEAEQALLGAVLFDNGAYERLNDQLQAQHFYEPFHARLFAAIESHVRKGQLAEPIVLADTGDAEVLVLPPQRSERASLASFSKSPNLDEHVTSALLLFSDDTANELLAQIQKGLVRKAPEVVPQLGPSLNPTIQQVISQVHVRLVASLLDNHRPAEGFFDNG